jgi:hypothetical protein
MTLRKSPVQMKIEAQSCLPLNQTCKSLLCSLSSSSLKFPHVRKMVGYGGADGNIGGVIKHFISDWWISLVRPTGNRSPVDVTR